MKKTGDKEHTSLLFMQKLLFFWLNRPILDIWKCRKTDRKFSLDDFLQFSSELEKSSVTTDNFMQLYKKNLKFHKKSLYKTILGFACKQIVVSGVLELCKLLTYLLLPSILKQISNAIKNGGSYYPAYGWCIVMFLIILTRTIFITHSIWIPNQVGIKVYAAITSMICIKTFDLSNAARQKFPVGKVVQLVSADARQINAVWQWIHISWSAPLQVLFCLFALYREMGRAIMAGICVFIVYIPIQAIIISRLSKQHVSINHASEKRIRLLQEVLAGIRVIKYSALESIFEQKISELRDKELLEVRKQSILSGISYTLTWSTPIFAFAASLIFHSRQPDFKVGTSIFTAFTYFCMMKRPIYQIPLMTDCFIDTIACISRLEEFLNATLTPSENIASQAINNDGNVSVSINDANFEWDIALKSKLMQQENKILSDLTLNELEANPPGPYAISPTSSSPKSPSNSFEGFHEPYLSIPKGSLVAIIGPVGSGKSSLLAAIQGEMPKLSGELHVKGSMAICPQQSWIQNASVRENILFGCKFDAERYQMVVDQCSLLPDLQTFPDSDVTELGEHGINLSGGQRLRINLARAVYHDPDIILLDDPLSAVDAHVGKAIFEKCILNGLLAKKTRLLVTHHLHILPHVDNILVLENGRIVQRGTFKELCELNENGFSEKFKKHVTEQKHDKDLKPDLSKALLQSPSPIPGTPVLSKPVQDTRIVQVENIYKAYIKAVGRSRWFPILTLGTIIIAETCRVGGTTWIKKCSEYVGSVKHFSSVYCTLEVSQAVFACSCTIVFIIAGIKASRSLHEQALHSILASPLRFFDSTPTGRILSRFSKDQDIIDSRVPFDLYWLLYVVAYVLSSAIQIIISILSKEHLIMSLINAILLVAPILGIGLFLQLLYSKALRQFQEIEAHSFSPLMSHISELYSGISVINTFKAREMYINRCYTILDSLSLGIYINQGLHRWAGVQSSVLAALTVLFVGVSCVYVSTSESDKAGSGISCILDVSDSFYWCIAQLAFCQTSMYSVYRIYDYIKNLASEAPRRNSSNVPPESWPEKGFLEFKNVTLSYRHDLPPVLKNISFIIEPRQRVAIVGRTGAGKSTILSALFRINELLSGQILIDNIDIQTIGLYDLRSKLSIVPQDPVLFSGTLRHNLDPEQRYSDADIWRVLERVSMHKIISKDSNGLDQQVHLGGENFSIGQRQLLCLARAILRNSRFILLDEATASIDFHTDALIQQTLRQHSCDRTVLTIAHRIDTILDYDKIMVLDSGNIVEFESPVELLKNPNSMFYGLAKGR